MKTYIVQAVFEHSVTFEVKAKNAERAGRTVEIKQFSEHTNNYREVNEGNFGQRRT